MTKKHLCEPPRQSTASRHFGSRPADPLGLGLRTLFKPIVDEPIPDSLRALLELIDAREGSRRPHMSPQNRN